MKCLECKGDFEPVRNTAKFCSSVCRLRYSRDKNKSISDPIEIKDDLGDNICQANVMHPGEEVRGAFKKYTVKNGKGEVIAGVIVKDKTLPLTKKGNITSDGGVWLREQYICPECLKIFQDMVRNNGGRIEEVKEEWVPRKQIEITPEVEKKLEIIYRQFEKENPKLICKPYMEHGKRILTQWELIKLELMDDKDITTDVSPTLAQRGKETVREGVWVDRNFNPVMAETSKGWCETHFERGKEYKRHLISVENAEGKLIEENKWACDNCIDKFKNKINNEGGVIIGS